MEISVLAPNDCTEEELASFFRLVEEGRQVNVKTLMNRIKSAKLLAFGYVDKELICVSSIKIPDIGYKKRIFKSASLESESKLYAFELGYSMTKEKHRGNGYNFKLNSTLLSKLGLSKVYATTANKGMIHLLKKLGFKRIGKSFEGKYNEELEIYGINIM